MTFFQLSKGVSKVGVETEFMMFSMIKVFIDTMK